MKPASSASSLKIDEQGSRNHAPEHIEAVLAGHQYTATQLSPKQERKLMSVFTSQRIDWRLLPILSAMYAMSLIDRSNLGYAMVAGMDVDLGLDLGSRYTIAVMIFFVAYVLLEIPSNLVLPRAGPANWLSFLGVGFGATMIGIGFTRHWDALVVCRALLGGLEAGFLPGCTYLITCWYTRYEVGKRIAGFWIVSTLAGAFSAILAYALSLLEGKGNLNGWRYIFIIEGAITIAICGVAWFVIVDFPSRSGKFLKPEERDFIIARLNSDRGDAEEDEVTFTKIVLHLRDWRLYAWMFNLMATTLPGYAYSYFLPIILRGGMGFGVTDSQLLSAPPYGLAAVVILPIAWLSDRTKVRGPIIAILQLATAIGMLLTAYGGSSAVRYFGAFLGIGALQPCVPLILTFQANNITSHSKRAVASATTLIGGGIGGIIAGAVFISEESPEYTTGVWTTFSFTVVSIISIIIMDICLWRLNKAAGKGSRINEDMPGWMYTL